MLEVQAVIARTYAVAHLSRHQREGFDLCSTTHCQLYEPSRLKTSTWAPAAVKASSQTAGMLLWYNKSPARALFHADCGGHTSAAGEVWGGTARPYLIASADDGAAAAAHTTWRYEVERSSLLSALNADIRTRVGKQLREITVARRDEAGRAGLVVLRGTRERLVRGEEVRAVLTRAFGPKSIRSTSFDIGRTGSRFVFSGRGYGHGVGLCQAGALARLKAGARLEQVLVRYYPGTRLVVMR
jgi:stage II sporulation protein D